MAINHQPGRDDPYHPHSGSQAEPDDRADHTGSVAVGPLSGIGRLISVCGAVASLALIAGVTWWGYKLVMRDVSGVPVVRAIEGPMRVQPDNPGGQPADHQGLAVNAVAAVGTAAPPPDRLILAPRPVDLDPEDKPMNALQPTLASLPADAEEARPVPDAALEAFRNGSVDALAEALAEGVEPLADGAQVAAADASQPELAEEEEVAVDPADLPQADVEAIGLDQGGVAISLRPQSRPARAVKAVVASADLSDAIDAAIETAAGLDVDPGDLPAGTRLAQLGAYDSPEIARAEWDRLAGRFADYLDGKQRVVQKASSGGRTFYRLRAMGFDDLSDARRFCSALVAENADCIPVTHR